MKKVILCPNPYRDSELKVAKQSREILESIGFETVVCLPFHRDGYGDELGVPVLQLQQEIKTADLLIAFGGDGTILHLSRTAALHHVPVLGINLGSLGFMSELEVHELDRLRDLKNWDFTVESRMMLDVTVHRDRDIIFHDICLNDVVITKGAVARIVHLAVKCDGVQAMECGGDGVIIATPTGSTAYSLSAGGPIVEPEAQNILITPICPHDMLSRCMVASQNRVVTVNLIINPNKNAYLSVDGGRAQRLNMGDVATVRKSKMTTKLIRLKNRSFYDVVNSKFRNTQG